MQVKNRKDLTDFGKTLRKARGYAGISLSTMACNMGISRSFISNIEHGNKKVPRGLPSRLERYFGSIGINELRLQALADASNGYLEKCS